MQVFSQRILARTERIRKNYGDAIKWYQTALAVFGSTSGVPAQFKSETEVELKQLKDEQKHDEEASRQAQAREEEREYARFRHLDDWSFIGVKRSANQDTIKTAIRKMWLKYHPDRGAGSSGSCFRFNIDLEG